MRTGNLRRVALIGRVYGAVNGIEDTVAFPDGRRNEPLAELLDVGQLHDELAPRPEDAPPLPEYLHRLVGTQMFQQVQGEDLGHAVVLEVELRRVHDDRGTLVVQV